MSWPLLIIVAYLVGSIPFGVLIARARGIDIRAHGSKNIGATNVGRVLGRKFGILCFLLDFLKGALPVLVAGMNRDILGEPAPAAADAWWWTAVAVATVLGHMASIFLRFAGGKGVATTFGALVALWPYLTFATLGALVTWILVVRVTRYVSLASMAAAVAIPLLAVGFGVMRGTQPPTGPIVLAAALAILVIWRHRANIGRLRRGEEPAIGTSR